MVKSSNSKGSKSKTKDSVPKKGTNEAKENINTSGKSEGFWTKLKTLFSPIKKELDNISGRLSSMTASKMKKEDLDLIKNGIAHIELSLDAILKSIDENERLDTKNKVAKIEEQLKRLEKEHSLLNDRVDKLVESNQKTEQDSTNYGYSQREVSQKNSSVSRNQPDKPITKGSKLEFSSYGAKYYAAEPQDGVFTDFSDIYRPNVTLYLIQISKDSTLGSLTLVDDRQEKVRLFRNIHSNLRQTCNLFGVGEPTPENINEEYGIVRSDGSSWVLQEKINLKW